MLPDELAKYFSHFDELTAICKQVHERGGERASELLLQLAAVGLAPDARYGPEEFPNLVRVTAEAWLDRLDPDADHRMAMAFGLASLRIESIEVTDPGCVSKSFPDFWSTLAMIRRHQGASP